MSAAELRGAGVQPSTVRVSVGLEDPEDLLDDLRQALA
jgi:O-acetylhomoserine (thiol)-lyase